MEISQIRKSPLFLKIIFIVSVAIIFFIGAITFKHVTVLKKTSTWISKSYEVSIELERLLSYIKDAETGQRGYLLSRDKSFLTPYYDSNDRIKKSFKRVTELTINSRTQQINLTKLQYLISRRLNYLSKNLYLVETTIDSEKLVASNLLSGKLAMDSIRVEIQGMITTQKNLLKYRQYDYNSTMNYTPLLIYLTLLITLILLVVLPSSPTTAKNLSALPL